MEEVFALFFKYGSLMIFIIILLEHINIPGLAAGVILPAVGVLSSKNHINLIWALLLCLLGGLLGNLVSYYVGYFGGSKVINYIMKKFPKCKKSIEKVEGKSGNSKVVRGVVCRFIPDIRTLIPIIEGGLKRDFKKFSLSAVIGIWFYNLIFIGAGYLFGTLT